MDNCLSSLHISWPVPNFQPALSPSLVHANLAASQGSELGIISAPFLIMKPSQILLLFLQGSGSQPWPLIRITRRALRKLKHHCLDSTQINLTRIPGMVPKYLRFLKVSPGIITCRQVRTTTTGWRYRKPSPWGPQSHPPSPHPAGVLSLAGAGTSSLLDSPHLLDLPILVITIASTVFITLPSGCILLSLHNSGSQLSCIWNYWGF